LVELIFDIRPCVDFNYGDDNGAFFPLKQDPVMLKLEAVMIRLAFQRPDVTIELRKLVKCSVQFLSRWFSN
jgi:hypothetical protein